MLIFHDLQAVPPSLSASVDAKQIQEGVDVVHCGHTVAAPQPFEFAVADSCNDGIVALQFDVAIVLLDNLCLVIEGLSVIGRDEFVSFHGAASFLVFVLVGNVW